MNKLKICLAVCAKKYHHASYLTRKVNNTAVLYKHNRQKQLRIHPEQHIASSANSHKIVFLNIIENRNVMS
jgi:hypothetical protein